MRRHRAPRRSHRSSHERGLILAGVAVWTVALSILPAFVLFHHWFIPGYRIAFLPF